MASPCLAPVLSFLFFNHHAAVQHMCFACFLSEVSGEPLRHYTPAIPPDAGG